MIKEVKRIKALDGLRGLAALVVLVHHSILASSPTLDNLYNSPSVSQIPSKGSFNWLIFYTPLHIFWAGPEFVAVFFVLSGFVLALPVVKSGRLRLASYYPSRLLRLYLPVGAALIWAAFLHVIVSHQTIPGASSWLNAHDTSLSWHGFINSLILGPHAGNWAFNTALWTMYWMVIFAVIFPLLCLLPLNWRAIRLGVALASLYWLLSGTSAISLEIPPFILGTVLAFEQQAIEELAGRWQKQSFINLLTKSLLALSCVTLMTADRWMPYGRENLMLVVLGACLAVIGAVVIVSWRKGLETPPMQWVGKRAFSLYLVHEPLVVALAFLIGTSLPPWLFVIVCLVASLGICSLFFRFIEKPSHAFARQAGIRCADLSDRLKRIILPKSSNKTAFAKDTAL